MFRKKRKKSAPALVVQDSETGEWWEITEIDSIAVRVEQATGAPGEQRNAKRP